MAVVDAAVLAEALFEPVQRAGRVVMDHYARDTRVELKSDASPVTAADRDSEEILLEALARHAAGIPVLSEESVPDGPPRRMGSLFFLVDPLDGTREFINKRRDFTINVALIEDGAPVFGMVYAPAGADIYFTLARDHAMRCRLEPSGTEPKLADLTTQRLRTRAPLPDRLAAVASRSHLNDATRRYLEDLGSVEIVHAGSSLKFCTIARGAADVYPRLAPTMEWDTAAGQAVLAAAGGAVLDLAGAPLTYGHAERDFTNPGFVAWGRLPQAPTAQPRW